VVFICKKNKHFSCKRVIASTILCILEAKNTNKFSNMKKQFHPLFFAICGLFWVSNSFAQTFTVLKDLNNSIAGPQTSGYSVGPNNSVYFLGNDATKTPSLWKTDGTPASTVFIKNVAATGSAANSFARNELIFAFGKLFFWSTPPVFSATGSLYVSDGTAGGTTKILDLGTSEFDQTVVNFAKTSTGLYFANDFDVYKTDGTTAGTNKIYYNPAQISNLTVNNDSIYFVTKPTNGAGRLQRADKNFQNIQDLGILGAFAPFSANNRLFLRTAQNFSNPVSIKTAGFSTVNNFESVVSAVTPSFEYRPKIEFIGSNYYFLGKPTLTSLQGLDQRFSECFNQRIDVGGFLSIERKTGCFGQYARRCEHGRRKISSLEFGRNDRWNDFDKRNSAL
jgi:ELWxxDGT repeat protein